jgi:hypothetical protein
MEAAGQKHLPNIGALGQYYFGIRYAAAFFERFVVKADRYQSVFLSQSHMYEMINKGRIRI